MIIVIREAEKPRRQDGSGHHGRTVAIVALAALAIVVAVWLWTMP
jgi:hypothetical protein